MALTRHKDVISPLRSIGPGAFETVARISGLNLASLPSASKDWEAFRGTQQRDIQALVPCAHDIDGLVGTSRRDSVTVDIASLLKGSATNESSAAPSHRPRPGPATSIPPSTTLPPIIGPPSLYADVAGPSLAVANGARARRTMAHSQASDSPAKKQSKWSAEEDALIIELRGSGMKWDDISKRLPGRSPISCRLHYQNYLERRSEWDEERKNKLARLYER